MFGDALEMCGEGCGNVWGYLGMIWDVWGIFGIVLRMIGGLLGDVLGVVVDLWGILKSVFWIALEKIGQRPSSQVSNKSARGPNSIFQFSAKCPNLFSKNLPEGRITFFRNSARGQNNIFPKFGQRA